MKTGDAHTEQQESQVRKWRRKLSRGKPSHIILKIAELAIKGWRVSEEEISMRNAGKEKMGR